MAPIYIFGAVGVAAIIAILYSLRILIGLERRMITMEQHLENIIKKVAKEEFKIEKKLIKNK